VLRNIRNATEAVRLNRIRGSMARGCRARPWRAIRERCRARFRCRCTDR
jgi:hypothetical protein